MHACTYGVSLYTYEADVALCPFFVGRAPPSVLCEQPW